MKKLLTILLAAALCLSLAACGDSAPDKQPAIDAYNELVENYNKFVDTGPGSMCPPPSRSSASS